MEFKGFLKGLLIASVVVSTPLSANVKQLMVPNVPTTQVSASDQVLHFGASLYDQKGSLKAVDASHIVNVEPVPGDQYRQVALDNIHASQQFDKVFIHEGLSHHVKQQRVFERLSQALKDNGTLTLELPDYNQGRLGQALSLTLSDLSDISFQSVRYISYSPKQYKRMIEKTGLSVANEVSQIRKLRFSNKKELKEWFLNHWAYTQAVHPKDKELFVTALVENYLDLTKQTNKKRFVLEQHFTDIEAIKTA